MIYANLYQPAPDRHLRREPILIKALEWLRSMNEAQSDGITHLLDDLMYVNVHRYETRARSECRFESHRRYVDLQYCISGGELIDYCRLDEVTADGDYDAVRDFHFHRSVERHSVIRMCPGDFAIFYPMDVHRPKVSDGINPGVRKLVVKIDLSLFEESK